MSAADEYKTSVSSTDDKGPKDLAYYRSECSRLRSENEQLRAENAKLRLQTATDVDKAAPPSADEKESAAADAAAPSTAKKPKKDIKIPFVKIEDEAFLIRGDGASMCVTSCDGELNPPFISAKGIKWLKENFHANDLDIVVDTYAKCGTTVGIKMVYKILEAFGQTPAGSNSKMLNDPWNAVPWIEVEVSQQLAASPSPNDFLSLIQRSNKLKTPRIWKSHQPVNNLPMATVGENTKILHIVRNPKDVVCSYFDFFRQEPLVNYKGSFDTLFDWYCDGSVVHSSIFEFELNWARALRDGKLTEKQLLIIAYEDIVRSPADVIQRVAEWLGFRPTEKQRDAVAEAISFARSKKEAQQNSAIGVIVNKGKIGRWKDILSAEQSARIDRIMAGRLKGCGIDFTFE